MSEPLCPSCDQPLQGCGLDDCPLTQEDCPNRPEWAMPGIPAIVDGGFCVHCSKVAGEWVTCEAARPPAVSPGEAAGKADSGDAA